MLAQIDTFHWILDMNTFVAADSFLPLAKIGVSVENLVFLLSLDVAADKKIERLAMMVRGNSFNFMQSFCRVDGSKLIVQWIYRIGGLRSSKIE
ncbi:hypothetical protein CDL15_Pgr012766 [Punica granatum]|uniref:Uncharacterized protein n=1 Tax=Punica granatum TaxID=22663 RepID=A0A218XDJ6_PUNGR|nr:hypothetical protein CDL15_Pgr012766 [Punica granatum]